MGAKATTVRLTADSLGLTRAFEVEHAARLLSIKDCGWRVAEDEKLEWTGYGFKPRKDSRGDKKSK